MSASEHASGGADHDAHHHPEPNYWGVFIALGVLTAAELGVVKLSIPHMIMVIALVGLALTKAIAVAAFFMHLKFERTTLALIAATPLVLCAFLIFMLMPDARVL